LSHLSDALFVSAECTSVKKDDRSGSSFTFDKYFPRHKAPSRDREFKILYFKCKSSRSTGRIKLFLNTSCKYHGEMALSLLFNEENIKVSEKE